MQALEIEKLDELAILQPQMFAMILDLDSEVERVELQEAIEKKATKLGVIRTFKKLLKAYAADNKKVNKGITYQDVQLKYTDKGLVLNATQNYLSILRSDKKFKGKLITNELSTMPEKVGTDKYEEWTNVDDSKTRNYIEDKYGIRDKDRLDDAFNIAFYENTYNPVKDIIEAVEWDGTPRVHTLLTKWLGVNDSEYTREVCRLIFAGGINRLYDPGCKFDDMPVLIGTKQGEGKSSFVAWLALEEDHFREVKDIEGQKGVEILQGAWVCEMGELLALTKTKEVEAVKAYITCRTDTYRKPYERRPTKNKRHCFFIGTTNKAEFLTDKTGNRRFYPVVVNCVGYDLFDNQVAIKADILQCWAEALRMYKDGNLPAYADRKLAGDIKAHQEMAVEDDYRVGMIEEYLETKQKVCVLEIWEKALKENWKPSRKDSCDIGLILTNYNGWIKEDKASRHDGYGIQKCWVNEKMPF